jgi:hypothetical protein
MKVGGSDGYTGNMSELIIYSSNRVNDRFDIETNLNIYYNIYRNSSYLKTWYDQSGSGRHAQQVTAAYQPIIVSSGSLITDGGLPSIKFSSTYYLSNSSTLPVGSTFSVFSVLRKITHSTSVGYFTFIPPSGNDYSSAGGRTFTHGPSLNYFRIEASGMDLYYLTPGTERFAFSGVYSGTTMSSRINNSGLVNTTHATTINSSGLVLGARYAGGIGSISDSVMNEFILYGTNQNSNRVAIENNINSYYLLWDNIVTSGLVLNLDAGKTASYSGTGTTWIDLVSGNNGTLLNGPTYNSTNGGTIVFDGVNDRVSTFSNKFPDTNSKTIDVWFRSTSSVRQGLCGTRPAGGIVAGWVFTINRTTSGRLTYFHTGSGVAEFSAGITTNTWYNAVVTHDYTTGIAKVYINGTLLGSSNVGSITSSPYNGVIGDEDGDIPSVPFKGNIPKVTMYSRVLSDTEVLQNFNQTRSRFGI